MKTSDYKLYSTFVWPADRSVSVTKLALTQTIIGIRAKFY